MSTKKSKDYLFFFPKLGVIALVFVLQSLANHFCYLYK
jgi:hypothetical protein